MMPGQSHVYFGPVATLKDRIDGDILRAVAVTTGQRVGSLPQTPTISESGYQGFEYANWHGLFAPANTPRDIIAILEEATVALLRQPETVKRFEDLGLTPVGNSSDAPAAFIKSETETWGKIIAQTGIKIE